jgi:hypothetical protein
MKRPSFWCWLVGFVALISAAFASSEADEILTVHEWGTFTALQDEQGVELSGINTDDEPVPKFVHNLNPFLLSKPVLSSIHWQYRQKAAPRVHPRITMRLETPVVYFYPPKGWQLPQSVDVSVRFRGGWLTEFYPKAQPQVPGLKEGLFDFGELTPETASSLVWHDVQIGTDREGPVTSEQVWLTPRKVAAEDIAVGDESERYLFYRGVGRVRAPLRAVMDRKSGWLTLSGSFDEVLTGQQSAGIAGAWLVNVREDGRLAYRTMQLDDVTRDRHAILATTSYRFEDDDFGKESRSDLEAQMHAALIADGLYVDEATAMLNTWQKSYFQSPGLRIFYLVPRVWSDYYLPLSISTAAKVERVMVGRLELVSDPQRALLDRLAQTALSDGHWVDDIPDSPAKEKFLAGRTDFGDLGVAIPPDYQMYLALGRFRNALVAHEERIHPTSTLTGFINNYQLHPFRLPTETAVAR